MRVLLVNKFLYPKGGGETYVLRLGEELEKLGADVQYFGMDDEKNVVGNEYGVMVGNMDFHRISLSDLDPYRFIWSAEAYRKMRLLLRLYKPNVVHLNNFNYQLTPSIIDAAKAERVPVVVTAHDSQFLCPNHYLYIPEDGKDPKRGRICQKCVTGSPWNCLKNRCVHNSLPMSLIGSMEGAKYRKNDTYQYISKIICPSGFLKDLLDTDARFAPKTVKITNFTEDFPVKEVDKEDYVLYAGRISPEKGMRNLAYAAKNLPDIEFHIAGTGDTSLFTGLQNVKILGFLKGDALYNEIRKSRLSLVISICAENCPMSILESQKLGTACLVTPFGGAKEFGTKEYMVKDGTPEALTERIKELMSDPNKIRFMEEDGKRRATGYPDLRSYAEAMLKIYSQAEKE